MPLIALPEAERSRQSHLGQRLLAGVVGLAACLCAIALAMHYPLAYPLVPGLVVLGCVAFFLARQEYWLVAVPATLPIVGLAPWTGWITFEELDILVLCVAAGGYLRMALPSPRRNQTGHDSQSRHRRGMPVIALAMAALFGLSTLIAMFRGFLDAGGFSWGWYQGYHEPMNSLRLAKSFFEAALLLPLWHVASKRSPEKAQDFLSLGVMLGLAAASTATLWERGAFTGLFNFSADYRTTAMFWEMHVGGAALDGFLALTLPFAVRELILARTPVRWGLAAATLCCASYACLTTFSRGVYLATPVGVATVLILNSRQPREAASSALRSHSRTLIRTHLASFLALTLGFGVSAVWIFRTSGYRGMIALLITFALMLPIGGVLKRLTVAQRMAGAAYGLGILLFGAVAMLAPKGAYIVWGCAVTFTIAALAGIYSNSKSIGRWGPLALAGYLGTVMGTAMVIAHWGGMDNLWRSMPVLLAVAVTSVAAATSRRALWPTSLTWHGSTIAAMCVAAAVVSVFSGGDYMSDRFSTSKRDFEGREAHWRLGLNMLNTQEDWLLGKGSGRFPSNYFLAGNLEQHPGDFRLQSERSRSYLKIAGGLHVNGWGEIFRVTQRVAEPGQSARVSASVRADKAVGLHFEVCEKHLLYNQNCLIKSIEVKGMPGDWQHIELELPGDRPTAGHWFAPRFLAFSVAVGSVGGSADISDIDLLSSDGKHLLVNGNFSDGMSHWFFSSDRHHLPWHIKSVFFNELFDQGAAGLVLWSLMVLSGLWRTSFGRARLHPLAPAIAASLAGFLVVGLFDSLLDVPRLAWLFYLLLMLALTLEGQTSARTPGPSSNRRSAMASAVVGLIAGAVSMQPDIAHAKDSAMVRPPIQIGPSKTIKTIAQYSAIAMANDTIEVDSGTYIADVAVWTVDGLTLRAVGGRVSLLAQGAAAEGKGTWVVRANSMHVEGFDFVGSRVPGRNGAGIRFESGSLTVRNCTFTNNENGILTGNQADARLNIESSEFSYNGFGDGQSHNLYVGTIASLAVTGSYFHHARVGHLLKSRAATNHIVDNWLVDGDAGTASYELEFPAGGIAYVARNVIAQSTTTENPHLISFGIEGYRWPRNEIRLEQNTLVNPLGRNGVFLRVAPGAHKVQALSNRLVGEGSLETAGRGEYRGNVTLDSAQFAKEWRDRLDNPMQTSRLPARAPAMN